MNKLEHSALVRLQNISVKFDDDQILNNLSLDINEKEFVTLLGPSGCGKTTTLRILGGFVKPDSGDVLFEGERINDVPPYQRQINTIFQKYALFPHLNVYENVAFGLRVQKKDEKEIKKTVNEMLELVNLKGFNKRYQFVERWSATTCFNCSCTCRQAPCSFARRTSWRS